MGRERPGLAWQYVDDFPSGDIGCSFAAMAIIAINARLVIPGRLDGIGWFSLETVQRMVTSHPEHEFHLFFDRNPPEELFPGENVTLHWVWPPARRPFLVNWWMDHSIPWMLRRTKANLFLSPDGFLSRRTTVPQVAVQHDLNFEHHPEWLPPRVARHYRKRFPEAARAAVRLATVSQYSAEDIAEQYGIDPGRIDVVYNGAGAAYHGALGLDMEQEAQRIRARLTEGRPYFVFIGTQHPRKNMEGLLRAFRRYREQGGQWDLLLVGKAMWRKRGFDGRDAMAEMPEEIKAHIHGSDWLPQDELASVLAAAEGLVFIPWFEGFGIPLIEAFSAGTPTIHSDRTSLPEVAAGAGLEVDPGDAEAVAAAMLRLEREPALGERLVELGRRRAEDFNWERTASLLWQCMAKAGEEAGLDMGPSSADPR